MYAARDLGHEYVALTDHSPRLTVARGLTAGAAPRADRRSCKRLNKEMAPFRILTGIEVDILDDGSLDQEEELLAELDIVVASVHSKLRMDRRRDDRRMVMAVANPNTDILGHCTGRLLVRPRSAGVGVRRRDSSSRHASSSVSRSRSTRVRNGSTRRCGCSSWRSSAAACSRSTPTRMRPASSSGSATVANAPRKATLDPARVINTMSADDLLELLAN